ncbi:hypothetical protein MHJ85_05825 [Brevibacterium ravenspurgense]|uniref:DUF6636 domain-containing protein n=1 Tax=Brevibacterium ravenspurgense TaxID=479117 RepID=UPI001EF2BBF3|nr:DUF6636 domain-containing protein [Brevibacterium ravenspurgense]MCG7300777.1 hypothetical protein [Brevibacterium ravenspurgense]
MSKPSDAGSNGTPSNGSPGFSSENSSGAGSLHREIFDSEVDGDSTRQMSLDEISEIGRQRSSEAERFTPPPPPAAPPRSGSSAPSAPPVSPERPAIRAQSDVDAFPPPPVPPTAPTVGAQQVHHGAPQAAGQMSPQAGYAGYAPAGHAPASYAAAGYATAAPSQGPYQHAQQQEEPKKKSNPPWAAIAFTTVLALFLVGGGLYIFFDMRSSDDHVETTAPPEVGGASSEAKPEESEPAESTPTFDASEAKAFITPSGNISCVIYKDRARCTVYSFDYSPGDKPENCSDDVEWGSVAEVTKKASGFSCKNVGEGPSPEELGYGKTIKAHGFECSSQKDGVRCKGPGGSFHVRKAEFKFD